MQTVSSIAFRTCSACWQSKPLAHFRKRSRADDRRFRQCNECHAASERQRRQVAKEQQQRRQVRRFSANVKRARSLAAVDRLIEQTISGFASVDEFLKAWASDFRTARDNPGSVAASNHFAAIVALMRCRDQCHQPPDFDALDDDGLQEFIVDQLQRRIENNPAAMADILRSIGWQISPPTTQTDVR